MTGWINVGGSSSSEPTPPPPNYFRERPGDISVGPRGVVEPAETERNFNANTKDLRWSTVHTTTTFNKLWNTKPKQKVQSRSAEKREARGVQTRQPLREDHRANLLKFNYSNEVLEENYELFLFTFFKNFYKYRDMYVKILRGRDVTSLYEP